MITISLCMIVRDEEDVLDRCLSSVKTAVDEIIIVDTGSADSTKKVAFNYTESVYDFAWKDDFASARNFSMEKASKDYILWLDADDVLPEESVRKLCLLKEELEPGTDMVMMPYAAAFDTAGKSIFVYYRERLVRNSERFRFLGRVHEVIPPAGKVRYADIVVEHRKIKQKDNGRNLRIYQDMEKKGEHFDSRALYYYGRELLYHKDYKKGAEILQEFLERPDGWKENQIDASRQLAACFSGMGKEKEAVRALLRALEYDVPRGESCCSLGKYFMEKGEYGQAVYWYKQALEAKKELRSGAFVEEECYGYIPAISLCVCYDRMGEHEQAEWYNDLAAQYKPDSIYCENNRKYFRQLKSGLEHGKEQGTEGKK